MGATSPGHSAASRLVPLAALMIVMAVAALGYFAVTLFNHAVQPELDNRSQLIGIGVRNNIERALALDVPLDQIAGTEKYLLGVMTSFPEVARIAIRTAGGVPVTQVERRPDGTAAAVPVAPQDAVEDTASQVDDGTFRFAILSGNSLAGEVLITVDHAYVEQQFVDVFLDVLVVILVVLLLAFEVMLAAVTRSVGKPLDGLYQILASQAEGDFSHRLKFGVRSSITRAVARFSDHAIDLHERYAALRQRTGPSVEADVQRDQRLADIGRRYRLTATPPHIADMKDAVDMRLPLFLFATGEELSKSFLPLLVRSAATDMAWINQEVLVSLPLIAYLLALIVLSPLAGGLTDRYTARKVFLFALLPVGISHIGLSVSSSVAEFVVWRGVAGAGYALATITCQEYALCTSTDGKHGRAMGGFVTVVIGGTFCGTAVGGVLADRLGANNTFLVGATLVAVSAFIAFKMMSGTDTERVPASAPTGPPSHSAFSNRRFVGLLLGIAIPANIMMASFLWYVVPLALSDLGSRPADIGRVLMIYYLITILAAPVAARWMDRAPDISFLLASGGAISGVGLLCLTYWYGVWPMVGAVALAGIGHAIVRATQVPLTLRIAATSARHTSSAKALAALRMWERAGSAIGLATTGVLVGHYGYGVTIGVIGVLTVAGTLAFLAIEMMAKRLPDKENSCLPSKSP
ncbi:MFS transporter [Parapusillimonas sp. SGNA-6]|nr:MFS transporter [Parapusillimonas sp. SGNA-6]